MKKQAYILFGLGALLLIVAGQHFVVANEPVNSAVSACERYANQQRHRKNPADHAVIRLLPENVLSEKYEAKLGRQFISSVLSGHGLLNIPGQAARAIQFTCLLENDKTPRFFRMTDDPNRDSAQLCWEQFKPAGWGELTTCLQDTLQHEESTLKTAEANAMNQADQSLERAAAYTTLMTSSALWQQYRDAECNRQQVQMAGANHPDVRHLTCQIQVTRQRTRNLQFDQ